MKKRGFTLLELLIVIAIISIATISLTGFYLNSQVKARDNQRKADLRVIASALERYYANQKEYPCVTSDSPVKSTDSPDPWIPGLTSTYTGNSSVSNYLFKDPINNSTHYYAYFSTYLTPCGSIPPIKTYQLWAGLENKKDPEIWSNSTAKCKDQPPILYLSIWNYCIESRNNFVSS